VSLPTLWRNDASGSPTNELLPVGAFFGKDGASSLLSKTLTMIFVLSTHLNFDVFY